MFPEKQQHHAQWPRRCGRRRKPILRFWLVWVWMLTRPMRRELKRAIRFSPVSASQRANSRSMTSEGRTATTLLVMNQTDRKTGLDRLAYIGAPRGIRNAWPEEIDWRQ